MLEVRKLAEDEEEKFLLSFQAIIFETCVQILKKIKLIEENIYCAGWIQDKLCSSSSNLLF